MVYMGNVMYSNNDIESFEYRMSHHVRRITFEDLDILGHGLKQYVERYKLLIAYNDEEEKILNELNTLSELLISHQYDKLIHDPRYMIDPNPKEED